MYLGPVKPLCIIAAVLLQYFFLASFIAMAGEAVVLYIELVKVFQSEIHHLVLKTAIITWGEFNVCVSSLDSRNVQLFYYRKLSLHQPQ